MSTAKKDPLFGPRDIKLLKNPFSKENPIIVQVLGICSTLAVTVKLQPAFVMAVSVTVVVMMSNFIISLMRNTIPPRIRIIVQLVVVSLLVIIVDQILKAFAYDISKQLSVYVGLIITNCIVMGRLEAFAMSNKPLPSLIDGLGNGLGYGVILIAMGVVREILGSGTLWDIRIMPEGYIPNGLMIMPAMALILLGIIIWVHRSKNKDLQENE